MSVSEQTIRDVALRLRTAADTGVPITPFRDELAPGGVDAAYAVQEANTAFHLAQGRKLIGRKIGATSKAVQMQLGVDSPDFGMLFADMALADGDEVALQRVSQPKAEAEVAFVLENDLLSADITMADVISAVAYALPAIEIVGSRIEKWNIRLLDTVADNASSGLFVLGNEPRKLDAIDLRMCGMVMEKRGQPVSVGLGAACLGHPLNAALWLAKTMVGVGRPLKAGDIVMSGALGPLAPIDAGDRIDVRINGLGSVRAAFAS